MTDKDKLVNIADLKVKLRYWCKTRGMAKTAQDSLMETINRIPYTVKYIASTLETTEMEQARDDDTAEWIDKEVRGSMTNVCSACGSCSVYPDKYCGGCGRSMKNGY